MKKEHSEKKDEDAAIHAALGPNAIPGFHPPKVGLGPYQRMIDGKVVQLGYPGNGEFRG